MMFLIAMQLAHILTVTSLSMLCWQVRGFSNGAPTESCGNLLPLHNSTGENNDRGVCRIGSNLVNGFIEVYLKCKEGFKGFILAARDENNTLTGVFSEDSMTHLVPGCNDTYATVTQSQSLENARDVTLKWTIGNSSIEYVYFFATVVQSLEHYISDIQSNPVNAATGEDVTTTTMSTTTTTGTGTTGGTGSASCMSVNGVFITLASTITIVSSIFMT